MLKDITDLKACPDCSSNNVSYSQIREQLICRECGLIFEPLLPQVEEQFERSHGMIKGDSRRLGKLAKEVKKSKQTKKVQKAKPVKKKDRR